MLMEGLSGSSMYFVSAIPLSSHDPSIFPLCIRMVGKEIEPAIAKARWPGVDQDSVESRLMAAADVVSVAPCDGNQTPAASCRVYTKQHVAYLRSKALAKVLVHRSGTQVNFGVPPSYRKDEWRAWFMVEALPVAGDFSLVSIPDVEFDRLPGYSWYRMTDAKGDDRPWNVPMDQMVTAPSGTRVPWGTVLENANPADVAGNGSSMSARERALAELEKIDPAMAAEARKSQLMLDAGIDPKALMFAQVLGGLFSK